MIAAPQGFRRTAVLKRTTPPGRSSRGPGLTNCPPNRGKVTLRSPTLHHPHLPLRVRIPFSWM